MTHPAMLLAHQRNNRIKKLERDARILVTMIEDQLHLAQRLSEQTSTLIETKSEPGIVDLPRHDTRQRSGERGTHQWSQELEEQLRPTLGRRGFLDEHEQNHSAITPVPDTTLANEVLRISTAITKQAHNISKTQDKIQETRTETKHLFT